MPHHRPIIRLLLLALLTALGTAAEADRMGWWREARFGMFIHWSVSSVPAGEYRGKRAYFAEWLMHDARIPIAEYQPFARGLTAEHYDPDAWVRLAQETGMRYIVMTAKHHDGFAMFRTAASRWNAVDASPYGKDAISAMAAACGRADMRLGFYYSQDIDWVHGGALHWIPGHTKPWDPAQSADLDAYVDRVAIPQVRELLTNYGRFPDLLWWDGGGMDPARGKRILAEVQRLRPGIIMNNRLGRDLPGDLETPEGHIPARGFPNRDWETCMTSNRSWGFSRNDQHWKPAGDLIRMLSDCASKGGNFLLNVGPDATGTIPAPCVERLRAIGDWMRVNAAAIHGTSANPLPRVLRGGRITRRPDAAGSGETLYVHVWDWAQPGGVLLLPHLTQQPDRAAVLGDGRAIAWRTAADALLLDLPQPAPAGAVPVIALHFPGAVRPTRTGPPAPATDGTITADALELVTTGGIRIQPDATGASLEGWTDAAWTATLDLGLPPGQPREWIVEAEVCGGGGTVELAVGKTKVRGVVPRTEAWTRCRLGPIRLDPASPEFVLRPVAAGWGAPRLRRLVLTPRP
jgi:alpha-L-fucosidase